MKILYRIIICLTLIALFSGCKSSAVFKEPSPHDLAKELIQNYMTAISHRDYASIRQLANIPDSPFISDASIEMFLVEKGADRLMGEDFEIASIDLDPNGHLRNFTVFFLPEENNVTYSDSIAIKDNAWYLPLDGLYLDEWKFMVPPHINVKINGIDLSEFHHSEPGMITIPNISPEPLSLTASPTGAQPIELCVTPSAFEPTAPLFQAYANEDYINRASSWYIDTLNSIMRLASDNEDIRQILPYFDMTHYDEHALQNLYTIIREEHEGLDVQITQYEVYSNKDDGISRPCIMSEDGNIKMAHLLSYNWIDQFGFPQSMFLVSEVTLTAENESFKIANISDSAQALSWVNHFTDDR